MGGKAKILVVEDEPDIVLVLKARLKKEGFGFIGAKTAAEGLRLARREKPDLMLLDVMLPDGDGHELIRILRRESSVPVIFLTAKKSELDRVLGFKLGADDYVTKPFSMAELVARIEAILRRAGAGPRRGGAACAGGISVDLERCEVRVDGRFVELAPREFQILNLLLEADGKVLSRDRLLERLWGAEKGMEFSTRTIDQHVARLRRKLRSENRRILTVRNSGYRIKI